MTNESVNTALNAVCPYFTMFPLDFPFSVLSKRASSSDRVLDPFCGRGTTNYASRSLGLHSIGIDNSLVAVALSRAKIANTTPTEIIEEAHHILAEVQEPDDVPEGEFWKWAYEPEALRTLCRFREGLLNRTPSDARHALRAIILGGLHGPAGKTQQSYFSNQSQRTYAPKPRYAVRYWKKHHLRPSSVDVMEIIQRRAERYYGSECTRASGEIIFGDSRDPSIYDHIQSGINWIITSPPYYGMRTYRPDQWLRLWFLGGPPFVDYSNQGQIEHSGIDRFIQQLGQVWNNVALVSAPSARLIIRFGMINGHKTNAKAVIKASLHSTPWAIQTITSAGRASDGKRQALHFRQPKEACPEYDVWAIRCS